MASSLAMGGTLRHLRDLFGDGTAVGLGDGQLLARYTDSSDEAAFEALVARHGPMVLATCRAVLKHEHDVEDAFQATFLVLARKARSVRGGDALGGWLHRVAYRASVQASVEARRRRRREAEASAMTPLHSAPTDLATDVAAIVHEEVDRLPEKHRLPVVLCDLEGLTYEQAAGRLRWTVPTLRCRLAKARQQLDGRLDRRGITAGDVVGCPGRAGRRGEGGGPDRPGPLGRRGGGRRSRHGDRRRPLGRPHPEHGHDQAEDRRGGCAGRDHSRDGRRRRGRGLASGSGPGRDGPAGRRLDETAPGRQRGPTARIGGVDRGPGPGGRSAGTAGGGGGRADVLHSTGTIGRPRDDQRAGRPVPLRVPPGRINSVLQSAASCIPWVVASAPGFGPGWASAVRQPGAPDETTVRLEEDGPPIEGRIVDLEGRPVAGARVKVEHLWFARERQPVGLARPGPGHAPSRAPGRASTSCRRRSSPPPAPTAASA